MKSARLFVAGMYLYLILGIVLPFVVLFTSCDLERFIKFIVVFFWLFYLVMTVLVVGAGWACVGMADMAYRRGEFEKLRRGWRLLKFASIPFYIINFFYSCMALFILAGSTTLLIIFVMILFIIPCMMVFQSGFVGWCYMKYLKKQPEIADRMSSFHYVMQVVMGLDVISTFLLCQKEKMYSVSNNNLKGI